MSATTAEIHDSWVSYLNCIQANPGIVTRNIAEKLDISSDQVSKVLYNIFKAQPADAPMILKLQVPRGAGQLLTNAYYTPANCPPELRDRCEPAPIAAPPPLADEADPGPYGNVEAFLDDMGKHPGTTPKQMAARLGLDAKIVAQRLGQIYKSKRLKRCDREQCAVPGETTPQYRYWLLADMPKDILNRRAADEAQAKRKAAERIAEFERAEAESRAAEEKNTQSADDIMTRWREGALRPDGIALHHMATTISTFVDQTANTIAEMFGNALYGPLALKLEQVLQHTHERLVQGQSAPPPPSSATPRPARIKAVVVGLKAEQARIIGQEFSCRYHLDFVPSGNSANAKLLKDKMRDAHHAFVMVNFVSHAHTGTVKASGKPYAIVAGGMSDLRRNMEATYRLLADQAAATGAAEHVSRA